MQNDMLKNTVAPWQEKGRWYHAHVTESGVDNANTDDFVINNVLITVSASYAIVSANFAIIDYEYKLNVRDIATASAYNKGLYVYADGKMGALIPRPAHFTTLDMDLWFFIVEI